jgi:hypothetical protein
VDRPTRIVAIPGERLPRCCEYGAYPARSASSRASARAAGGADTFRPREGRKAGPRLDMVGPALRDSPMPLVTAGVSAVGFPTRPLPYRRLARRLGAWTRRWPGRRSARRPGWHCPGGMGPRSRSAEGEASRTGGPRRRGVLQRRGARGIGRGDPADACVRGKEDRPGPHAPWAHRTDPTATVPHRRLRPARGTGSMERRCRRRGLHGQSDATPASATEPSLERRRSRGSAAGEAMHKGPVPHCRTRRPGRCRRRRARRPRSPCTAPAASAGPRSSRDHQGRTTGSAKPVLPAARDRGDAPCR